MENLVPVLLWVGIIGAVFSIFVPPIGLAVCLIGLILGLVSKLRGATGKVCPIISIPCMALWASAIWRSPSEPPWRKPPEAPGGALGPRVYPREPEDPPGPAV